MSVLEENSETLRQAVELANEMLGVCRDELLTTFKFTNRPIAYLPARVQMERGGCMTDGREALFSPAFVLDSFKSRKLINRAYLHMIIHCLLRRPFPNSKVDPLVWSVASDLACECVLSQLECPQIEVEDDRRDRVVKEWVARSDRQTAASFYALLKREGLSQSELANIEIAIGTDSHELWFDSTEGAEEQDSSERCEIDNQTSQQWEKVASATQLDIQRDGESASSSLSEQLGSIRHVPMSLEDLLRIYATPHETMTLSDEEFDNVYYTYGLRELGNIALVEPLEYGETPHLRDFCIAIDTSGSCSGKLVRAFLAKACGLLLESSAIAEQTRIWLVQCDSKIQSTQLLETREQVEACLASFAVTGLGGTDFRPVFEWMEEKLEDGEVPEWEALLYFTDGQGTFPEQAAPYDTAFVFVDSIGPCPRWATSVLTYTDELENQPCPQQ